MNKKFIYGLILAFSIIFTGQSTGKAAEWQSIGSGRQVNISGMALVENTAQQTVFIVVHDNKKKKEKRAGIIRIGDRNAPQYMPLEWLGKEIPVDLEAISAISGMPNNFMTLTSAGKIYHIELDQNNNSIRVIKSFDAPSIPAGSNFEGFALQKIGDNQLAVWAERGENEKPGTLFWSRFETATYTFTQTGSATIKVPYPSAHVRHISDIKVDRQGRVFISSAADPGDDGPFASAVYLAGNFNLDDPSRIVLDQSVSLSQVFSVNNRKIEAFEIIPGEKEKMAFGTDDENLGSAVYTGWQEF